MKIGIDSDLCISDIVIASKAVKQSLFHDLCCAVFFFFQVSNLVKVSPRKFKNDEIGDTDSRFTSLNWLFGS